VVGNSGSGKSTLAKAIAARLQLPYVELDAIYHQAGWQPLPVGQFQSRVAELVVWDGWVIDGNYSAVRPQIWACADTVVWLDLPRWRSTAALLRRTVRRVVTQAELWNGNRERWRNLLSRDPAESVVVWSWRKHAEYRERYAAAAADPTLGRLRFHRLRTRGDTRRLLAELREN
jgi:adenylate kinase family enzyme